MSYRLIASITLASVLILAGCAPSGPGGPIPAIPVPEPGKFFVDPAHVADPTAR